MIARDNTNQTAFDRALFKPDANYTFHAEYTSSRSEVKKLFKRIKGKELKYKFSGSLFYTWHTNYLGKILYNNKFVFMDCSDNPWKFWPSYIWWAHQTMT